MIKYTLWFLIFTVFYGCLGAGLLLIPALDNRLSALIIGCVALILAQVSAYQVVK